MSEVMMELHGLDTDKQVFFYEQDFYVLSNFSAFNLRWKSWEFPTLEHAYHWEKFAHQNPPGGECDACYAIRRAPSAHDAFTFGKIGGVTGRRADWNEVRIGIMRVLLREKVRQHEYVRRKLLKTGDRELIENSWRDDFWGWGPNRDGQNMLGKLWMEIRAELRTAQAACFGRAAMTADQIVSSLRKGHPIMGPDSVDLAAADKIEQLLAALSKARGHVWATNEAEHMLDGFGPRRSRPSDGVLAEVDAALGHQQLAPRSEI